jgi:hypothetical protein
MLYLTQGTLKKKMKTADLFDKKMDCRVAALFRSHFDYSEVILTGTIDRWSAKDLRCLPNNPDSSLRSE